MELKLPSFIVIDTNMHTRSNFCSQSKQRYCILILRLSVWNLDSTVLLRSSKRIIGAQSPARPLISDNSRAAASCSKLKTPLLHSTVKSSLKPIIKKR